MATITKTIGTVGAVEVQIDYDDSTLRVSLIRVINLSTDACYVQATRTENGRTYGQRFIPGTSFISIPQSPPADRLQLVVDANGRLDGVEWYIIAPYP